jgi:tetratricopeptide (TPR) repeat protein
VVEGNRGIGKTAFALQALRRFMDRDTFGGLVWITAAARKEQLQLSHVLDAISLAIDYPFKAQTRSDEKESLLRKELDDVRNVRCLLLLDNFETVADRDVDAFVFDPQRRPRNLSVLLTSTGRVIRPGVRAFPLDELDQDSAIAMFRERCTRDGLPQESQAQLVRLYEVVGGNPLALEWIIGQMREGDDLVDLITELRGGKAEILSRVFQHSWDRLGPNEHSVLEAITIFIRPALHESLVAAAGLDDESFRASLKLLSRLYLVKSLKLHEGSNSQLVGRRYFVHPFTRDFLQGQLGPGACALYSRAMAFYRAYVPERGGTPEREETADIAQLNGERENILGVLDGNYACNGAQPGYGLVLQMARWLFIESHWDDLERYGSRAVADATRMGDAHVAARILAEVGRTYAYRSDFERATDAFERAQALAATPPPDGWALAYIDHHRGEALMRQRRFDEAHPVLAQSLEGFQRLESKRSIIGVRYRMALLAYETQQFERAKSLASRGVEDTIVERWARLEGFNRRILGDLAVRECAFAEAEFQYRRALELVPRSDMRIQALLELSLAVLEQRASRLEAARARAGRALVHFEKLRMPSEAEAARRLAAGLVPDAAPA